LWVLIKMTKTAYKLIVEKLQDEFKKSLESKNNFFVISYLGTEASDFGVLRSRLKKTGARTLVLKNSLTKNVLKKKNLDEFIGLIEGPTAFVLEINDPISVSKVLVDFSKEHKSINLRGGFLEDRLVDYNELRKISEIPSKDTLHYMLCNFQYRIVFRNFFLTKPFLNFSSNFII